MRRGLWLLIPLLLLALLYAGLPALAGFVAVRWLESRGFEQPQLELEYPGYRQLRVSLLAFGQHSEGRHVELSGTSVEIGYDLPTLLFERRLSWVRVPRIELSVSDSASSAGRGQLALAPLLPAAWLSLAPADRIQVGQLQLIYSAPSQPARQLRGNIDLENGILHSRLQLFEDDNARARADLELGHDTFDLRLLQHSAPVLAASGRFRIEGERLAIELEQRLRIDLAQQWQRHWLPALPPLPDLRGELQTRGRLSLPLTLELADPHWWHDLELQQTLSGDLSAERPLPTLKGLHLPLSTRLHLQNGQASLQLPAGSSVRLEQLEVADFAPVDSSLRLQSDVRLAADLDALSAGLPAILKVSPLQLELRVPPLEKAQGTLRLSPLQLHLDRLEPNRVAGTIELDSLDWQDGGDSPGIHHLSAGFELHRNEAQLELQLSEGSEAKLRQIPLPPFAPLDAAIRLTSPLHLGTGIDDPLPGLWLKPAALELSPEPLQHPDGILRLSPLRLRLERLEPAQPAVSASLDIERIAWQMPGRRLPTASLQSRFSLEGETLSGRLELQLDDPELRLQARASGTLEPFGGDLYWRATPLPLEQSERLWNRYYPPAPPELTITKGLLYNEGSANWTESGLALRFDQRIEDLSASWGAIGIEGGHWQARTLRRRSGRLEQTGSLQVALLDAGFPIEAAGADYRLTQLPGQAPELRLDPLRAQLLGGSLGIDSVTINPLSPRLETRVRLQQVRLSRLLELQQQPGLSGEGRIGAELPVRLDDDGLSIDNGRIHNENPGWIRFSPDDGVMALGRSNRGMAMALQALENFHYDELSASLRYAPDGTAQMNTRLRGHNPNWNRGQAVDFSINIEQNLLKLLQTLQFTDQLTESIEKRYR
ncbi:hypothetical protein GCM10011348_26580 [Marinobacterium nitratireducens]|uniref:Dicarboxylate transport domain-containing protein n=1 Tax=Marinobacterium nitratireducens TaxID=518897 RepID=A0A917ZK25_9GAMM|nr:YdbH domain-containing protein [Marinobacterium nitratireducens]GGO83252.1 hypothetical protein GCM10011348_26580 [Marinobacterium nitratireducens]